MAILQSSPSRDGTRTFRAQLRTSAGALVLLVLMILLPNLRTRPEAPRLTVEKVSLESGSWSALAALPGSSSRLGRRIVSFRKHVTRVPPRDRLRSIPGVGTRRLHGWCRWLDLEDPLQ